MCLGTAMTCLVVVVSLLECPTTASQLQSQPVSGPHFNLTVNQSSKSITVYVEPGNKVKTRWCYGKRKQCTDGPKPVVIDPLLSRSAVLKVSHLVPCLCVEVYYTSVDSERRFICPLTNSNISDVTGVWDSTVVELYENRVSVTSVCLAADIKVTAALCWKQHEHLCTAVFNLSLVETVTGQKREYNTSVVDKHPQMCVQLSLQGNHNVSCRFKADMSTWSVHTELGRQGIFVNVTSLSPAKFSVQLCKLNQRTCTPVGQIYSLNIEQKTAILKVPLLLIEERPCVQVWKSEPALHGRRILCPDYTRSRCGIYAVAALAFVVIVIGLGICIHHLNKKDTAGWLYIQRPVLLVCSSEESSHVSSVCTLASILQGELGATAHLALWAQSTQKQSGTGVADLGPLPWLYGQWETVMKAQGNVLIIWSPDAKEAYNNWWNEKEKDKSEKQKDFYSKRDLSPQRMLPDDGVKLNGLKHGKCKVKKSEKRSRYVSANKDTRSGTEPCTVIAPVFKAALTCLMGALQENKGQRVVFVCLQGHGNSKDIPKAFRGVPRYCLPLEFSGLIQELGVITVFTKNSKSKLHCWSRLMSKVLLFLLAKRLACRLQASLPQSQSSEKSTCREDFLR